LGLEGAWARGKGVIGGGERLLMGEGMLCSWEEKWREQKITIIETHSGNKKVTLFDYNSRQ
jgi:hypothetical protein